MATVKTQQRDRLGPYLLGPNDTEENGIYIGDARELAKAIPDESADLIFTDPVYDRIGDYGWLAETAVRTLKQHTGCLSWCRNEDLFAILKAMCPPLRYVKTIAYNIVRFHNGIAQTRYDMHSTEMWTPCVWLEKGECRFNKRFWDYGWATWTSDETNYHRWQKPARPFLNWLRYAALPGQLVFDPFTGGGTVPAVCKMLGRRYLAFEIDPETAQLARERVRNTQPPLFVSQPEQIELAL